MSSIVPTIEQRLTKTLKSITQFNGMPVYQAMAGDGSTRSYVRLVKPEFPWVFMVLPMTCVHEEIGSEKTDKQPYVSISNTLQSINIPVPEVIHYDPQEQIVIVEDMGDDLLEAWAFPLHQKQDRVTTFPHNQYQHALDQLISLQAQTTHLCAQNDLIAQRKFDFNLWQGEWQHFIEYGVEVRGNLSIDAADRAAVTAAIKRLADRLTMVPYVAVHRDYHSRNLMRRADMLYWIDFQDMLLGPAYYDVASLLYDAYVNIPETERHNLKQYYDENAQKAGIVLPSSQAEADNLFALIAVQRMLKAAGRFVYFDRVSKKPQFLSYIPELLARVKSLCTVHAQTDPDLAALFTSLRRYVPEWQS